jgi:hypothetical protein
VSPLARALQYLTEGVDDALDASPVALPINAAANVTAFALTALDAALGGSVPDPIVHCCWLTGAVAALFVAHDTYRDLRSPRPVQPRGGSGSVLP